MSLSIYRVYERNLKITIMLHGLDQAGKVLDVWYESKEIGYSTYLSLKEVLKQWMN
jgi:hypothetical protein